MVKLSIIVPIYKVAQYLCKCVDSLLSQDIPSSEYEIILVDDGSPDDCPQICDSYAGVYDNIRVIHRENGGLSAARNSGIEIAQGEYLMFVDSDDYIELNVLGKLITRAESDYLDILRYNYRNVNEYYEVFHPNKDPKRDVNYSETITDGEDFLNNRLGPGCYAWQFVIKRVLLDDCLFKEGIYFEDTEWTPRMLVRAKRVASTETIVYNYLWREGSITLPDNPQKLKRVISDKMALIKGFKEQTKLVKEPKWFKRMISIVTMSILDMVSYFTKQEREQYVHELKSYQIFPLYTRGEKMLSHRVKIYIANISPSGYCELFAKIQNQKKQ